FSFYTCLHTASLHSFPTRRSSDLPQVYEAEYGQYKGDFDLFLNLIDKGSVLDLGCGTGRLAIPLAQKGLEVVGLGASEPSGIARDRKSTRLNSSHQIISYAVFCLK